MFGNWSECKLVRPVFGTIRPLGVRRLKHESSNSKRYLDQYDDIVLIRPKPTKKRVVVKNVHVSDSEIEPPITGSPMV